ncbi:nucleotide pyrophosphohydrolase [bacterium]|nr:nucleotide pyrophosphohydrolase [bacterium]
MSFTEYQINAMRTAKPGETMLFDLMHAAYGLTTETGEFVDSLKKNQVYNRPLDRQNLLEELGDILWYVSLACNALDAKLEDVAIANIGKLKKRYPEKYSDAHASKRLDKRTSNVTRRKAQGSNRVSKAKKDIRSR